jgi:hypothetical protein
MAIVGDAYVVVRAITSSVEADIQKAFNGIDRVGEKAGKDLSAGVNRSLGRSSNNFNFITPNFLASAAAAKERFSSLTRAGYILAPSITAVSGVIGLLGTGLISLTSIIGAAATPALITLAGAFTAVGQAALTLKLAFSGVAKAVQAGTKNSKKSASATKSDGNLSARSQWFANQLEDSQTPKAINKAMAKVINSILLNKSMIESAVCAPPVYLAISLDNEGVMPKSSIPSQVKSIPKRPINP